jgi:hypothetical protein
MATLKKMTRMGADVRQIARLLQAKAPENHMLAYITPEEAQMLKDRGGSGKPHADTGIPSFQDESYGFTEDTAYDYGPEPTQAFSTPVQASAQPVGMDLSSLQTAAPSSAPAYNAAQPFAAFDTSQFAQAPAQVSAGVKPEFAQQPVTLPPAMTGASVPTEFAAPPAPGKTFAEKAEDVSKFLDKNPALVKALGLGITGVGGLIRSRQGAKEAESVRSDLAALGKNYRQQGQEFLTKAQTGELTAPQQQQLQAAQAQLAQQASARGGVASQQTATQIEALRQQFVQQNMNSALQLLGIADQYEANAIKAGYSASKDAQAAADKFYSAMGQFLVPPSQQAQQTPPRG